MRLRTALIGVVLAACVRGGTAPGATPAVTGTASAAASFVQPTATPISIAESTYGKLVARTAPGARCVVEVHVGPPRFGDNALLAQSNGVVDQVNALLC